MSGRPNSGRLSGRSPSPPTFGTVNPAATVSPVSTTIDTRGDGTAVVSRGSRKMIASPAAPSELNWVTVTRYRVVYRRTDGRNTPGVDVPFPFDSAVTVTVTGDGGSAGFQLVRTSAKQEAPLRPLVNNPDIISTIADVTFYGRDQAGNDVSVTGSIGIDFGNFGDPQ